jgi:Domain of unknown function (DU1801)
MTNPDNILRFLYSYDENVTTFALTLRDFLLKTLPNIEEQLDTPARIIGYGYGPKYSDTICVMILSKSGLKLGFYKGSELPDPDKLLTGSGKVHKHVVIKSGKDIKSSGLKKLLSSAIKAYKIRSKKK